MSSQEVTDKQLAGSVRFQRRVTITQPEQKPVTGYVAGFDEETIFLAVPVSATEVTKIMVHRDWYSRIELHDESTLSTEAPDVRRQLGNLITKFRERILEEYFPNR